MKDVKKEYKIDECILEKENDKKTIYFNLDNGTHKKELTESIYEVFNNSRLQAKRDKNYFDRFIEHSEVTPYRFDCESSKSVPLVDKLVETKINNELLYNALNQLTEKQKRRIIKYFFEGKNIIQIAEEENTAFQTIAESIDSGKKILKNKI